MPYIKSSSGPLLVGLAALLWATDTLVRYPTTKQIDPTFIVLVEHILAVLILLPWLIFKQRGSLFALNSKEWFAAFFSGIGGSAIAFLLFTASFLYVNPSVSILLQKLQPVMVVLIAYLFLRERPAKKFYFWGVVALAAGIALSYPNVNFKFFTGNSNIHTKGIQYALCAALLWAASTVSSKILLARTPAAVATFWRFFFGLLALAGMIALENNMPSLNSLDQSSIFALFYLSLVPGLLAMLVYYSGLSTTPASVSSFIELIYPISAVALNTIFLHTPLGTLQTIAGTILLIAVAMISF